LDKKYLLKVGLVGKTGKWWPWETGRSDYDALFLREMWSGIVFVILWRNAMTFGPVQNNRAILL
jgi:hypothetical protein